MELNKLNIWAQDTMVNTVGLRQTELALMLGTLYNTDQVEPAPVY